MKMAKICFVVSLVFSLNISCEKEGDEESASGKGTISISPVAISDSSSLTAAESTEYPLTSFTFTISKMALKTADGDWVNVLTAAEDFEFVSGTGPAISAELPVGEYPYAFIEISGIRFERGTDADDPECDEETMLDSSGTAIGGVLVTSDLCTTHSGESPSDLHDDGNDGRFWIFNGVTVTEGTTTSLVFTIPSDEINDQSNHRECGSDNAPGKPTFFIGSSSDLSAAVSSSQVTCE